MKTLLMNKYMGKSATSGISGYVGLPLVHRYSKIGFKGVCFDVEATKIFFDDIREVCFEFCTM